MTQTLEDNLAVSHETKYLFRWLRTKESACQCWRHKRCGFKPWVRKILKGEVATHSSILAWKIPWTWSLIGCSLQCCKELDKTENASTHPNVLLLCDRTIALLGVHSNVLKSSVYGCIWMFIEALFIIAKTWKQPRCPLVEVWINCAVLLSTKNMSYQAMKRHRGILNAYY